MLSQKESQNTGCEMDFKDELERITPKLIDGTIPAFNGYYYLLGTFILKTGDGEAQFSRSTQDRSFLKYGNTKSGVMSLYFFKDYSSSPDGVIDMSKNEYNTTYNKYLRWVNGEERK